jgi:hypothetical protein
MNSHISRLAGSDFGKARRCRFPRTGYRGSRPGRTGRRTRASTGFSTGRWIKPVDYRLDVPKRQFLCHVADRAEVVLHGLDDAALAARAAAGPDGFPWLEG